MKDLPWEKSKGQKDPLDMPEQDAGPWMIEEGRGNQMEPFKNNSFDNLPDILKGIDKHFECDLEVAEQDAKPWEAGEKGEIQTEPFAIPAFDNLPEIPKEIDKEFQKQDAKPWEAGEKGETQTEPFAIPAFDNLPDILKEIDKKMDNRKDPGNSQINSVHPIEKEKSGVPVISNLDIQKKKVLKGADEIQTVIPTKPLEKESKLQITNPQTKINGPQLQDGNSYTKPPLYEPKNPSEIHIDNKNRADNIVSNEVENTPVPNTETLESSTFLETEQKAEDNLQPVPTKKKIERNKITDLLRKILDSLKGRSLAEHMNEMRDGANNIQEIPVNMEEPDTPPIKAKWEDEDIITTAEKKFSDIKVVEDKDIPTPQSFTENNLDNLKEEINNSSIRFDKMEGEIDGISTSLKTLRDSTLQITQKNDKLDSKITRGLESSKERMNIIENRIVELEVNLNSIRSNSTELRRGLMSIENNISELTSSYSTLLTRIDESATNTDSRLIELSERVGRIEILESKVSNIERGLADSSQAVSEVGKTISALMGDVAENYSSNETLRSDTKEDIETLKGEMKSVVEYVENGLKKAGAGGYGTSGGDVQLTHIEKNSSTMKLCMEWLEMLMELVGRNNLPDILSYYEELGWISDDVRLELMRYAEGIDYYMEKPDWKLNPSDHVKSIWFIEKLAGAKVDKNRLSIIERDIEKVKKGAEKIYGI